MIGAGTSPGQGGDRNVVCIKWGDRYEPRYVNRLRSMVRRNLSGAHRFICLTDDPEGIDAAVEVRPLPVLGLPPGAERWAWPKIGVLGECLGDLSGSCLFLDLDIVIVDRIDCFFTYRPGRFCIIEDWVQPHRRILARRPGVGNSSVFRFEAGAMVWVVEHFRDDMRGILAAYRNEQRYLTDVVRPCSDWWPAEWVASFKRHCAPPFPLNHTVAPHVPNSARIVAFHGRPKPDEAAEGYSAGPFRRTLPAPWIGEHWRTG